jgi:hypothetical protein
MECLYAFVGIVCFIRLSYAHHILQTFHTLFMPYLSERSEVHQEELRVKSNEGTYTF